MKKFYFALCVFVGIFVARVAWAEEGGSGFSPFVPALTWGGAWDPDSSASQRLDFRLGLSGNSFRFRAQLLDARGGLLLDWKTLGSAASIDEAFLPAASETGGAVYHDKTGSRAVYGNLSMQGLVNRTKNLSSHDAAWVSSHAPISADLKTSTSVTGDHENEAYLYLSTPKIGVEGIARGSLFGGLVAHAGDKAATAANQSSTTRASTDAEKIPASYFGGFNLKLFSKSETHAEFFYSGLGTIKEKTSSSWFPDSPPLPERSTRLYSFSLTEVLGNLFGSPLNNFKFAGDAAYSETYVVGRGFYWNAALEGNIKPVKLCLAFDNSSALYVDNALATPGELWRVGLKTEAKLKPAELVRIKTTLKTQDGPTMQFNDSSSNIYYHFPINRNNVIYLSRLSLTAKRDADDAARKLNARALARDSFDFYAGIDFNKVKTKTSLNFDFIGYSTSHSPFPLSEGRYWLSGFEVKEEAVVTLFNIAFTVRTGIAIELNEKNAEWKTSVYSFSISGRLSGAKGRLTLKTGYDTDSGFLVNASWRLSLI
jgi:hypothetical protein